MQQLGFSKLIIFFPYCQGYYITYALAMEIK